MVDFGRTFLLVREISEVRSPYIPDYNPVGSTIAVIRGSEICPLCIIWQPLPFIMAPSKLDIARQSNRLQVVKMNSVEYMRFQPGVKTFLGTEDLNGCTAVVIVSKDAAILGHISPRPSGQITSEATGDAHMRSKMQELRTLLHQHLSDFKQGTGGVVVYALYMGEVALSDQKRIIEDQFKSWKLPFTSVSYPVLKPGEPRSPAKGTVLIDAGGEALIIWVEDKPVARVRASGSSAGSSAGSSVAGSSK